MVEATEASSIHTSLTEGSASTTTAQAISSGRKFAAAVKDMPICLQRERRCRVSLSFTTTNCQQWEPLLLGAIRAARRMVRSSSSFKGTGKNLRIERRIFINSLNFSIYLLYICGQ